MDRFAACLPLTLAQECPFPADWSNPHNFSDDAHDPGGKTMCGITQREYDQYRKSSGQPTRDVRQIQLLEGLDIYGNTYWRPSAPKLPVGLDLCFFDAAVNEGTTEAVRILQVALGVANDGDWGPVTQAAVDHIAHVDEMIHAFTIRRQHVYETSRGFQYFKSDWMRRAAEIGDAALAMAKGTP